MGLELMLIKLKDLGANGLNSNCLKDFINLHYQHKKECKDIDCICKSYNNVLKIIRNNEYRGSSENTLLQVNDENLTLMFNKFKNALVDSNESNILYIYLNEFCLMLSRKILDKH